MHVNPAQEYGLSVKQNISATHFDGTESNPIRDAIGFAADFNRVELGILRRPECEICVKGEIRTARGVGTKFLIDSGLRNTNRHFLLKPRPVEL